MTIKDPIKEIIDEFQNKIALLKNEREEALSNFKNIVHLKKVEDIKSDLKSNARSHCKK